jgi:hypothetical protein
VRQLRLQETVPAVDPQYRKLTQTGTSNHRLIGVQLRTTPLAIKAISFVTADTSSSFSFRLRQVAEDWTTSFSSKPHKLQRCGRGDETGAFRPIGHETAGHIDRR